MISETKKIRAPERDIGARAAWIWLALIIAAGAALRLSRIGAESVDHEEYISLCHLDAPSLLAFLKLVKWHYPYSAPFSFAFEYLWSRAVGASPAQVRLLYVLVGTLTIPALYALGIEFYRGSALARRAGIVAAMCAAFSPVYVFHSQEARQYAFLAFLGLCSMYSFLRGMRDTGGKWWLINGIANLCLLWTHLFGVLLLFTEGLFLLCCARGHVRRLAAWTMAHVLLLVPLALWVMTIDVPRGDNIHAFYGKPSWQQWLWDIVADDAVYLLRIYPPVSPNAWQGPFAPWREAIAGLRPWFGGLLAISFCVAMAWVLWKALRGRFPGRRDWFFLLAWPIIPVTALVALSYLWQPCYSNRYTVYGSIALYVALGGMLASIPNAAIRRAHVAGIALLYAYQLSLSVPGPTRTDWRGVIAHVKATGQPDDLILVEDPFWPAEFIFNYPDVPNPVSDAYSRDQLCTEARFFLEQSGHNGVWILLVDINLRGGGDLERRLQEYRLQYTAHDFPGERRVIAYRITRSDQSAPPVAAALFPSLPMEAVVRAISQNAYHPALKTYRESVRYISDFSGGAAIRLAIALALHAPDETAAAALHRAVHLNPDYAVSLAELCAGIAPDALAGEAWLAANAIARRQFGEAAIRARAAADSSPADPLPCWLLWRALSNGNDMDGALEAIRQAYQRAAELPPAWSPLFGPVCGAMSQAQSRPVIESLQNAGLPIPRELMDRYHLLPVETE